MDGVSEKIRTLFSLSRKAQVISYCKQLELTEDDLVGIIVYSEQHGYRYIVGHKKYLPDQVELEKSDFDIPEQEEGEAPTKEAEKLFKKVNHLFEQRKILNAHIFVRGEEWHLFYFSYSDTSESDNHWSGGPHIHFINHLWRHHNLEDLERKLFSDRSTEIDDSAHIRYKQYCI